MIAIGVGVPAVVLTVTGYTRGCLSQAEIREHNARLTRDDPYYIRCIRSEAPGSLVKRRASCRTNQKWASADEAGNREARDVADAMRSKAATSN